MAVVLHTEMSRRRARRRPARAAPGGAAAARGRGAAGGLRLALVVLAWLAQFCLPMWHATLMATPHGEAAIACGDPTRLAAIVAALPPEIRQALDLDVAGSDTLAACAQLCATGPAPGPVAAVTFAPWRVAGRVEAVAPIAPPPRSRAQAPTPPSQAPPGPASV